MADKLAGTPLSERLKAEIAKTGPMPLDRFWQEAMTAPDGGYYMAGAPIGEEGDFTTAPEISQIFGELVGLWLVDCWDRAGRPAAFTLMELGPGRGQLMADALRAAHMAPDFLEAAQAVMVEASPSLRRSQEAIMANAGLSKAPEWQTDWRQALQDDDGAPLFLIGNEFLDALPIQQFQWGQGAWRSRVIELDDAADFVFRDGPVAMPEVPTGLDTPPEGAILEHAPERAEAAELLAQRIMRSGGAGLLIDYGYKTTRFGDSLQALAGGKPADPLQAPGQADITSHVDFARLATAAQANGATPHGPVDQGVLLLRLGAEARMAALTRSATPEAAAAIAQGLRRLIHPMQMGSLFKALAITPNAAPPPAGFET